MEKSPAQNESPLATMLASYGEIECVALSKIQSFAAATLARNWASIPHVTHHDLLEMDALEAARKRLNTERPAHDRLSPLPFLLRAVALALRKNPRLNCAFDAETGRIIHRKYINIGFAVDTPRGLLVPVVRAYDQKSILDIDLAIKALIGKARDRGLSLAEMSGGCFTVSSLGDLGGTAFTPIINAPEVAILGISRLSQQPYPAEDGVVAWRKFLPVSLSYDHRVLNGADAGRFLATLREELISVASGTRP